MAATAYVSEADFRKSTRLAVAVVNSIDTERPDFIDVALSERSAELNARLRKRYNVPLTMAEVPTMVRRWVIVLVSYDVLTASGFPANGSEEPIVAEYQLALEQIKETADTENGLYELPLYADETGHAEKRAKCKWGRAMDPWGRGPRRRRCR